MAEKELNLDALLKLPKCEKCEKMIVGKMMRALGKVWHDGCFVCTACGGSLADGYRVDETGQPDQPELPQHKPHCPNCYSRLFTPPCKGCGQNIGDKSYVNACNGAWHEKCFVCAKCGKELSSEAKHWPVNDKPYCQTDYWEAKLQHQPKNAATPQQMKTSARK